MCFETCTKKAYMACSIYSHDVQGLGLMGLMKAVKKAKTKYETSVSKELAKRRERAYATMFSPLVGTYFKPKDSERDWILLPDLEAEGSINHRVIVHYQNDNKDQMIDHNYFETIEMFVHAKSSAELQISSGTAVMAWATPIDDPSSEWLLMCWKVVWGVQPQTHTRFDTVVTLANHTQGGNKMWLAWVYDSAEQHSGLGVYATVSNSLFMSGYGHFFESRLPTAPAADTSKAPAQSYVDVLKNRSNEARTSHNKLSTRRTPYNEYTLKDDIVSAGVSADNEWTITKQGEQQYDWTINSSLRSGLKFYFSPTGVYLLDSQATMFNVTLGNGNNVWQKYMWEVVVREDMPWVFDTLLASLEEEFLPVGQTKPHSHEHFGRWRHWSYKKITSKFSGQLQYEDAGVRCITETTREGWTPYALVCGITPMPCLLHNRGYQWDSMKSLALHHQVAAAKVYSMQLEASKYLVNMSRMIEEGFKGIVAMDNLQKVTPTPQYFHADVRVRFLKYSIMGDDTMDNIAKLHHMQFASAMHSNKDQSYDVIFKSLPTKESPVWKKLGSKNSKFLELFHECYAENPQGWNKANVEDKGISDALEMAGLFMLEKPEDISTQARPQRKKGQRNTAAMQAYQMNTPKHGRVIMITRSHDFIDYNGIHARFAEVSTQYPMQINSILQYANRVLPKTVSVFMVHEKFKMCMWTSMHIHPHLQWFQTLGISNMCATEANPEENLQQVRLVNKPIGQPLLNMVDMLLGAMHSRGKTIESEATLQIENWNGGRCIFITNQSDADFAINGGSPPPFYMVLTKESFGKPKRLDPQNRNKDSKNAKHSAENALVEWPVEETEVAND